MDSEKKQFTHLEDARAAFQRFFESKIARLMVLKGPYGSGKSYFLREDLLRSQEIKEEFPFLAYTSVFGLTDLKELTAAAVGSIEYRGNSKALKKVSGKGVDFILNLFQRGLKGVAGVNPEISALSILWSIAHQRGLLLVIDDIDRRDESKFGLKPIIGFANSLAEHASGKVRVILILNEEQLDEGDKTVWEEQREKFIDTEYYFSPIPSELAEEFVEEEELKLVIADIHTALQSPNIRTMRKVEEMVLSAEAYLKDKEVFLIDEEREHAAKVASLFLSAGSEYPVEVIAEDRPSWVSVLASQTDHHSEEFKRFTERANRIKFIPNSSLDFLLVQFFRNGQIDNSDTEDFRNRRASEESVKEFKAAETRLWGLIHESFKDTSSEFVKCAKAHVEKFTHEIDLRNIRDIARVLSDLGEDPEDVWRVWLEQNSKGFKPSQREPLKEVLPETLHEFLPDPIHASPSEIDPTVFLQSMMDGQAMWEEAELSLLSEWDKDQWKEWLKASGYEDILPGVESVLRTSWDNEPFKKIKISLRAAVLEIVAESPIQRVRAERYFPRLLEEVDRAEVSTSDDGKGE